MSYRIESSVIESVSPSKLHWTSKYGPGKEVPVSGIYRCTGCKKEITSNKGDSFPPQNHHQHTTMQGVIQWKLNVRTNTDGATL